MRNEYLEEIRKQIVKKLRDDFGYCACADGEHQVLLSYSSEGVGFSIAIKDVEAIERSKITTPRKDVGS